VSREDDGDPLFGELSTSILFIVSGIHQKER